MALSEYKRRNLCTNPSEANTPSLTPAQYNSALSIARQLPLLVLEKAFFKVTGERFITPGSLVQFVVKARVIPPGSATPPAINPSDLEDIDPDEDDLDALLGRKPPSNKNRKARTLSNADTPPNKAQMANDEKIDVPLLPPLTHAPYFPRDHSPRWHVFLADPKMGKIAVPPFTMTTFSKPAIDEKTGGPTYAVQTFKMQFQAPPQAGRYSFVMHVVCDSYVGMDSARDVVLQVSGQEMAGGMESEGEISEPEEGKLIHLFTVPGLELEDKGVYANREQIPWRDRCRRLNLGSLRARLAGRGRGRRWWRVMMRAILRASRGRRRVRLILIPIRSEGRGGEAGERCL